MGKRAGSYRQTPQSKTEINRQIGRVIAYAGDSCSTVHLYPCDFKVVKNNPADFDCVEQKNGDLVRAANGRLFTIKPMCVS